jgi:1-aminocyclopropane-1-carboxylate deaminase/D-cysteine desulfhydrase-like pyridoxal-dependent ACC family enzyme
MRLPIATLNGELWLKQDGLVHPLYGGNKTRKAALLLEQAAQTGARRVLTFGAAGSHHVLATSLFARDFGLGVAAVLTPQPATEHAQAVLGRSLNAGLEAYPASSARVAPFTFLRYKRRGDYVVPPGGSNVCGARAYALAFSELEGQVAAGELPAPDWLVVPLGSGGTAAGLLAGLARSRLPTRLLAVSVLRNPLPAAQVRFLARRTLRTGGEVAAERNWERRLLVDNSQIGRGYGWSTSAGDRATELAGRHGLTLDATYTAKAFVAALELARGEHRARPTPARVLYWHTLSVPEGGPPATSPLPPQLARLFLAR